MTTGPLLRKLLVWPKTWGVLWYNIFKNVFSSIESSNFNLFKPKFWIQYIVLSFNLNISYACILQMNTLLLHFKIHKYYVQLHTGLKISILLRIPAIHDVRPDMTHIKSNTRLRIIPMACNVIHGFEA